MFSYVYRYSNCIKDDRNDNRNYPKVFCDALQTIAVNSLEQSQQARIAKARKDGRKPKIKPRERLILDADNFIRDFLRYGKYGNRVEYFQNIMVSN